MAAYTWDPITGTYVLSADQSFGVVTDQSDYSPGQTVQITATFDPGATVQFVVEHDIGAGADGIWGTADDVLVSDLTGTGLTWTMTADANGLLSTSWFVNQDALGQSFELVAVEQAADGTFTGPVAMTFFTDGIKYISPPVLASETPAANVIDLTGSLLATGTAGDAIFSVDNNRGSVGSGNFSSFVRIDAGGSSPTEQGYNTDARLNGTNGPISDPNNEANSSHAFTHSLDINLLAKVDATGTPSATGQFYEFALDVNQSGSSTLLSLDALQIYQASSGSLTQFTPPTQQGGSGVNGFTDPGNDASLIYNLDATSKDAVLINSNLAGHHGSGNTADIDVLIPVADFTGPGNFIYLYSAFGQQPDQPNTGGFEEWGALLNSGTIIGGNQSPELLITKTASATPFDTVHDGGGPLVDFNGEVVTYTVVLSNDGTANATHVALSDSLVDLSTVPVTFTDTGATDHAAYGSLAAAEAAGVLDAGENWTLQYTYTAQQSDIDNNGNPASSGFIENTVTATDGNELPPVSASANVPIDQDPSLSITKTFVTTPNDSKDIDGSGNGEADHNGQVITYTITVTNTGNETLTNVQVTDPFADSGSLHLVSSSDSNTTKLDVGQTWTFAATHTVTQAEIDAGTALVNTATVTDNQGDNKQAQATTLVDQDPSINVEKLVSVDGGKTWYTLFDANDSQNDNGAATLATISSETGIALANLHYGSPTLTNHAGNPSPMYEFVITNTGNVDLSNVTLSDSLYSNVSLASGTSLAVGSNPLIVNITEPFHAGDNPDTATVTGQIDSGSITVTDTDNADYLGFQLSSTGLTQGFWGTHKSLYQDAQDKTYLNLVTSGVVTGDDFSHTGIHVSTGKTDPILSNDDIIWALTHNGGTGTNPNGVLLGDANGDGVADSGEIPGLTGSTLFLSSSTAFTDLNTSSNGNSQTIMLNQLIAAQLNIYNGDHDPGSYMLSSKPGHDLVGEGVLWLKGLLPGEGGVPSKTSDATWTTKFFDTGIVNPSTGHDIMASGQDLKNVLQAFDQGNIVTSANNQSIGWTSDGGVTVVGVHANTPDEFWLVALQHGVITG